MQQKLSLYCQVEPDLGLRGSHFFFYVCWLTCGFNDEKGETPKVRPLNASASVLIMDRASSGADILTDSLWKSRLFPIVSVRLRTLFPKTTDRLTRAILGIHLCRHSPETLSTYVSATGVMSVLESRRLAITLTILAPTEGRMMLILTTLLSFSTTISRSEAVSASLVFNWTSTRSWIMPTTSAALSGNQPLRQWGRKHFTFRALVEDLFHFIRNANEPGCVCDRASHR